MAPEVKGSGTAEDPWTLKTPPGTSEYRMFRDGAGDPPALVCQVGSTKLSYDLRAIDDAGTGCGRATVAASACTSRPSWKPSGWQKSPTMRGTTA
jgi:hypothetical protein